MKAPILLVTFAIFLNAAFPTSRSSGATIAGQITDLFGTPLPGAVIEVWGKQSKSSSIRTDKSGGYLIHDAPEGAVTVTAVAQGFQPESRAFTLRAGEVAQFDVGLEPMSIADQSPVKLTGTIRNNKALLDGVAITVVNPFNNRLIKNVKTDTTGRYQVEFGSGGQYIVYASKPGFLVSSSSVVLPSAQPRLAELNFKLVPSDDSIYGTAKK
jgi:hypothetical protein